MGPLNGERKQKFGLYRRLHSFLWTWILIYMSDKYLTREWHWNRGMRHQRWWRSLVASRPQFGGTKLKPKSKLYSLCESTQNVLENRTKHFVLPNRPANQNLKPVYLMAGKKQASFHQTCTVLLCRSEWIKKINMKKIFCFHAKNKKHLEKNLYHYFYP